jgi:DNA polymerase-1
VPAQHGEIRVLVSRKNFSDCLKKFFKPGVYGFDCEATGLRPWQGDRLFSLILATDTEAFYFNFQTYPDHPHGSDFVLDGTHKDALATMFADSRSTWCAHNAKYDLGLLAQEGIVIRGTVHCTEMGARIERNDHFGYTLAMCAKRIGEEKSKAVDECIKRLKLYRQEVVAGEYKEDGSPVTEKVPEFYRVPLDVIVPYGCKDAALTLKLYHHQIRMIEEAGARQPQGWPKPAGVLENERRLTKTCFRMEEVGVKIDRAYCVRALAFERAQCDRYAAEFLKLTGTVFKNSWKTLSEVFDAHGLSYPSTEPTKTRPKGTPSFKDEFLETVDHPVGEVIRNWREHDKKANTYYENFLYYADDEDVIHGNIRQAGTASGRMSFSNPNLQNLNKEEDTSPEFLVRRAFVPRAGYCFVMIDFDQMEYRLMLDYAGELALIGKILGEGLDVHEATGQMMGVPRGRAKTLNFMLLYGGGVGKLARMLKIALAQAKTLKAKYFSDLPKIGAFIRRVMDTATQRGYIFNWFGRMCHFSNPEFAYAAPNYLIQGGCADIVKIAMNRVDDFLSNKRSRLLLQIHDELLFEVHESELGIVSELVGLMESVYPHKHLPLTAGASYSWKSWADKIKGLPVAEDGTNGREERRA